MSENPEVEQDAETRLQANPELVAGIEDAEEHPERRLPRPDRPS
jgi:hypothetical protein